MSHKPILTKGAVYLADPTENSVWNHPEVNIPGGFYEYVGVVHQGPVGQYAKFEFKQVGGQSRSVYVETTAKALTDFLGESA